MAVFELILGLLLGGVGLALLAPCLRVPWPALLALAGAALAFVPGMPAVNLDPDLTLALFFAPVLLDAAFDTNPRDLRANWIPLSSLVVVAVVLTTATVAVVARWIMPDLPWAAAVALGAVVAPPDAAAATAVLRQVRLPRRLVIILEGESLLNDASALLIYRFAVGAAAGGVTLWTVPVLVLSASGGLVLGYILARCYLATVRRLGAADAPSVLLQFLGTFGVWIFAERIGASAVLTSVAYAMTIARLARGRMDPRQRRSAYAVWDVAVFVLNVLAFILVGLQLRGILDRLDGATERYILLAGSILLTCILARIAWVMSYGVVFRVIERLLGRGRERPKMVPTVKGGIVISWSGMRGIVTLVAALALPAQFPGRDVIVFTAFCVVLGTLVLQGMTLRPLLRLLELPRDTAAEAERARARAEAARAALEALGPDRDTEAGHLLAQVYKARLVAGGEPVDPTGLLTLRRRVLAAERDRIAAMQRDGRIGSDTYQELEEELDWAEVDASLPGL